MRHSRHAYEPANNLNPFGGTRSLAYDQYAELSKQTRLAQANLAVNAVQAGLMAQMRDSLVSITAIMDDVRQHQENTLAIQQELLQREQIQSFVEEFIYKAEKLAAECANPKTEIPASSRYFMLLGVTETIDQEGIGTPIIRGRDNKAAFEKVVSQVRGLIGRLEQEPEVKEAIEWAEHERKRCDAEQRRLLAESNKRQQERSIEIKRLRKQREVLVNQRQQLKFTDWYKDKFSWVLDAEYPEIAKLVVQIGIWWLGSGVAWIPIWFFLSKNSADSTLNREVDHQIADLDKQIHALEVET